MGRRTWGWWWRPRRLLQLPSRRSYRSRMPGTTPRTVLNIEATRSLFLNLKSKEVLMIIRGPSDFNKLKTCYKSFLPSLSKVYTMAYPLLLTKCILYHETKFLCHILLTLFATKWILYDIYSVLFCSHFLPPLSIIHVVKFVYGLL